MLRLRRVVVGTSFANSAAKRPPAPTASMLPMNLANTNSAPRNGPASLARRCDYCQFIMRSAPSMKTGLIGYSGFVGSNLRRQATFKRLYNSQNFREMEGRHFDLLVCAGVSASKWIANRAPEEDRRRIEELTSVLATTRVDEFVLISTSDVYPDPGAGGDEKPIIDPGSNSSYGRYRYELEQWAQTTFPTCRIVRLPALFGPGLKKNALFDLIHNNRIAAINPA